MQIAGDENFQKRNYDKPIFFGILLHYMPSESDLAPVCIAHFLLCFFSSSFASRN